MFLAFSLVLDAGESTWDHPCDEYYRKLYDEEKKKKMKDEAKWDKSKQQVTTTVINLCYEEPI